MRLTCCWAPYVARFPGADTSRERRVASLLERVGISDAVDRHTSI
jgi:hypothetical protein